MKGALLDEIAVNAARRSLRGFMSQTMVQKEQGGVGPLIPTPTQLPVLNALTQSACGEAGTWLIINKPRQAMTSTLVTAWLLRDTMYTPGANGLLISNKDETNQELWSRLRLMHERLPDAIRVPAVTAAAKEFKFSHSGRLKSTTAKGKDPALGFSIDRLLASEFGFWADADNVWGKLAPAIVKRAHARVVIESTPGAQGCLFQRMFFSAMSGNSQFQPIFIAWHEYLAYTRAVPPGMRPDNSELVLLEKHRTMTLGHLMFRRMMLESVYGGDERRFDQCYPSAYTDGWLSAGVPSLPEGPLKALLGGAQSDPMYGTPWDGHPKHGHKYMIIADPNGYGTVGDPSAYTVFDLCTREEVGAWEGRRDPVQFGRELAELGRKMNDALVVCESNSAAAITSLVNTGYRNVYNDGVAAHPGYYRTAVNKERAIVRLVEALRDGQMKIRSSAGIHQLLAWDGSGTRAAGHHWDRCITYQIAADMLCIHNVPHVAQTPVPPGHVSERMFQSTPSRPKV